MARRRVYVDELIDSRGVAEIIGVESVTSVAVYVGRHADFPEPILDLGPGRPKLWHRPDVERWQEKRKRKRERS